MTTIFDMDELDELDPPKLYPMDEKPNVKNLICPFCKGKLNENLNDHLNDCTDYLRELSKDICYLCKDKVKGFVSLHLIAECKLGFNLTKQNILLDCEVNQNSFKYKMQAQSWNGLSEFKSAFEKRMQVENKCSKFHIT